MEDVKQRVIAAFYESHEVNRYSLKNVMLTPDMYGDADNDTFTVEYIDLRKKKPKTLEWEVKRMEV